MNRSNPQRYVAACVIAACLVLGDRAAAQALADLPPAAVPGSCKAFDLKLVTLTSPVTVDLIIAVDENGKPVSAAPLEGVNPPALLSAVVASAMSCKFVPARSGGKSVPGQAREIHQFSPAPAGEPLRRRPGIRDIQSCAPKADDYPVISRQLNETGTTRINFTVNSDGKLIAFGVAQSSGFLRLDFTALHALARCVFQPGVAADGTPISASFEVDYVWKLK